MAKPIYVLVADLFFAMKIVKTAEGLGLEARAFDSSERLLQALEEKEPTLMILDCEGLEREAFRLLERFQSDPKLSGIPRVGYLSHRAQELKREMLQAGCEQVYAKSEFTKELESLLTRYTNDFSSRI